MNQELINIYQKLIDHSNKVYYESKESSLKWKIMNFKKVLKILQDYPGKINSGEELKEYCKTNNIKGLGDGAISRINEILETHTLNELPMSNQSEDNKITEINNLLRVTGIGPSNAKKMVENKITLDKLLNNLNEYWDTLTHHQQIGLKYFKDFEKKIPRKEIISLEKKINKIITSLDSGFNLHICGSYRRGKLESGDIDILVTHNNIVNSEDLEESDYLDQLVKILTNKRILVDHLTLNGNTKYMGVCRNSPKGLARRIDIRIIPKESIGCALLYFTGSGEFNVNMRSYALKKGFKINEYYLQKKKGNKYLIIDVKTEEDIFRYLGLEYIEPQNRLPTVKF